MVLSTLFSLHMIEPAAGAYVEDHELPQAKDQHLEQQ